MTKPTLQFLGAARTVTGSKFLLRAGDRQVLIDCGLFQGLKELRRRNWEPMPFNPSEIDAVVLTHAHLDHTGYLPRLAKFGFRGTVYCSTPTAALLALLWPDSGHLQEEQARYANKKGFSKHKPALPLYTKKEAQDALRLLRTVEYGRKRKLAEGIDVKFHPSGHILGAAFAEVFFEGRRMIVSGDLGSYDRIVMRGPQAMPRGADYVLAESTYGGRRRDCRPVQEQFRELIAPVLERRGVVVIPSFAIGRTTLVLYHIRRLQERGEIPNCPVYVDSPMATDAVRIYRRFTKEHNLKVDLLRSGKSCVICPRQTVLVRKTEDSKALNKRKDGPAIIISASGMATGGRILHHLKHRLPDRRNMVLLVGYQAQGTRGRALLEGVRKVKMLGEKVRVRAKVAAINGLSAHGDSDDIIRWLASSGTRPKRTFLVHGEDEGLQAMAGRVSKQLRHKYQIPRYLQKVTL